MTAPQFSTIFFLAIVGTILVSNSLDLQTQIGLLLIVLAVLKAFANLIIVKGKQ